jgi:hypothetical protein
MHETGPASESDASPPDFPAEFRADPGAHWPMIIVCAVLALLATAGSVWGIIKPDGIVALKVMIPPFLALLAVTCVIGVRYYWVQLRRRYQLIDGGLKYFDGRQLHEIPWKSVTEIYEVISSVKLLGLTLDSPQLGVEFVTSEGVRCQVDKNVQGSDQLAPIVSREVNRRLSERARKKLERRQGVPFGCISLSETGVAIQELPPKPWWEKLKHRFESNVDTGVVVPGEYPWHDVRDIRVVSAVRGDRMADRTTYNQLQIRVQGRKSPVCCWAVPEFPNFTVFCEVLEQLGRPLTQGE